MIDNSIGREQASLSKEREEAMNKLRVYMFQNVYYNSNVKKAEDLDKVRVVIMSLFEYYMNNPEALPAELLAMRDEFSVEELVKDQIAGMTDRYAISTYEKIFG
jgi:dGTPase